MGNVARRQQRLLGEREIKEAALINEELNTSATKYVLESSGDSWISR